MTDTDMTTPDMTTPDMTRTDMTDTEHVNYIEIIETVITSLREEGSAMVSHNQEGGYLWKFNYGSVEVLVQLSGLTDDDTLMVWSSILPGPFKNELELLRKLMQLNGGETLEARFALIQNQIVVLTSRTVADLSPGEISRAVTIVATLADDYDDLLLAEFK